MSKSITFVQLLCRCAFIVVHILFLNKKKELKLVVGCYVPTKVRRVINNIATQYEHRMIIFAEIQGSYFPFYSNPWQGTIALFVGAKVQNPQTRCGGIIFL